ncbi:hypothetical protein AM499_05770 [Bacillus sp. FJAT-22090]|nr:hypothetical protein AM499_05770 [Bacillus sp. FJAT-22090]
MLMEICTLTKTNEKTLSIGNYVLLGKALHTLPETHFRRASRKKVRPKNSSIFCKDCLDNNIVPNGGVWNQTSHLLQLEKI